MKRLFFLFCFFSFMLSCYAIPINSWTDELTTNPNITTLGTESRYRWYKENITYSDKYYMEGENDSYFPLLDKNNYTKSDWSNWSDVEPENKSNRIIESDAFSYVRTIRPVKYLFLNNFYNPSGKFKISKINVLIDDNIIQPEMVCTSCSSNFVTDIKNGNNANTFIYNAGSLRLDLGDYYSIDRIKIELFLYADIPGRESLDVYYNEDSRIDYRNYGYRKLEYYISSNDPFNANQFSVIADKSYIIHPSYTEWYYMAGLVEPTFYREVTPTILYRYRDVFYRYYRVDREYLTDYFNSVDDYLYIKDDSTLRTFYMYAYRKLNSEIEENASELNPDSLINIPNETAKPIIASNQSPPSNSASINDSNNFNKDVNSNEIKSTPKLSANRILSKIDNNKIDNKVLDEDSNLLFLIIIFLIILLIALYVIRHHILSYQK